MIRYYRYFVLPPVITFTDDKDMFAYKIWMYYRIHHQLKIIHNLLMIR